jgi:hypothetical protein
MICTLPGLIVAFWASIAGVDDSHKDDFDDRHARLVAQLVRG